MLQNQPATMSSQGTWFKWTLDTRRKELIMATELKVAVTFGWSNRFAIFTIEYLTLCLQPPAKTGSIRFHFQFRFHSIQVLQQLRRWQKQRNMEKGWSQSLAGPFVTSQPRRESETSGWTLTFSWEAPTALRWHHKWASPQVGPFQHLHTQHSHTFLTPLLAKDT